MGFRLRTKFLPAPNITTDVISIEDSSYSVVEGTMVAVRLRRTTNKTAPVAVCVDWALTGLTQGAPTTTSGTLTWAAGVTGLKTQALIAGLVTATRTGSLVLSNPRVVTSGTAPTISGGTVPFAVTNDSVVPGTVTLSAAATSSSAIELTLSGGADAGSGFKEYLIERSLNGTSGWSEVARPNTAGTYSDTGRSASTEYFYRLSALDVAGNKSAYATDDATTLSVTGALVNQFLMTETETPDNKDDAANGSFWEWETFNGSSGGILEDTVNGVTGNVIRVSQPKSYPGGNVYGYLNLNVAALATQDIYVDFWAKMTPRGGLKFMKLYGDGSNGFPHTTFQPAWNSSPSSTTPTTRSGLMYNVTFSDGSTQGLDNSNIINFDCVDKFTDSPTAGLTNIEGAGRSGATATILTPQAANWNEWDDGEYHHFRLRFKYNSGTTSANQVADGAYFVEIDGQVYCDATGLFNRHYADGQHHGMLTFFEYSQNNNYTMDIRMANIRVSTGGFIEDVVETGTDTSQLWHFQDFSTATLGSEANSVGTISDAPGIIVTDPLGGSKRYVHDSIAKQDHNAFGFGSVTDLPHNLTKGDEIWVSAKVLLAAGSDHSAGPNLKWWRLRVRNAAGVHQGYDDLYLNDDGHWQFIFEGEANWSVLNSGNAFEPMPGIPCTIEMHVVFDNVPVSAGGMARIDVWKDGVLIHSVTDRRTLNNATDQCWSWYQWTYWNDGNGDDEGVYPLVDQDWYWTNHAVAIKAADWGGAPRDDSAHLTTDSNGLKMIGVIA